MSIVGGVIYLQKSDATGVVFYLTFVGTGPQSD